MKKLLGFALILITAQGFAQKTKQDVIKSIDAQANTYADVAHKIWEYAEVGYQETKSSALLQETLSQAGFTIEKGVAGMPTAFIATFGSGKPVIGILGEFDALPGISQDAVPEIKELSVYISSFKGGEGCVRDVIEQVMRLKKQWPLLTS